MSDKDMVDIDKMIATYALERVIAAGHDAAAAVDATEGVKHITTADLVDALVALKGPPGSGGHGIIGALQVVQRDIETELVVRMSKKWETVGGILLERSPANEWVMDSEALVRPLADAALEAVGEDDELTLARKAISLVLQCMGSTDKKWSTTQLREVLDLPKPKGRDENGEKFDDPLEDYGEFRAQTGAGYKLQLHAAEHEGSE